MAQERKAIVLVSGGLDSATTLAIARSEGYTCHALSFDYRQRHRLELAAARRVAESLGAAEHKVIGLDLRVFGGSALTDDAIDVPKDRALSPSLEGGGEGVGEAHAAAETQTSAGRTSGALSPRKVAEETLTPLPRGEEIPITYVPARNTIFLSYALAYAEVIGGRDIFIGVNAIDYSGYPDCRPAFIEAFEKLANLATKMGVEAAADDDRIRIRAPLVNLTKADIIRKGVELGVDYGLTVSCYDPSVDGRPCGRCDSCRLRAAGFREAGIEDPALQ